MAQQHGPSNFDPFRCGCCGSLDRREFFASVGLSALAAGAASSEVATAAPEEKAPRRAKPLVRAVFVRPDLEQYWMGWPGASYDIKGHQADYSRIMADAAKKFGVDLQITQQPISDSTRLNRFLEECANSTPDGAIVVSMSLNPINGSGSWGDINQFVDKRPASLPVIVFSPMGTSFTGHLQATRNKPKTLVAATQDLSWLAEAVRMFRVMWDMKNTRICIVNGNKTEDKPLATIGTTLHYIPLERWVQEYNNCPETQEVKALAREWSETAKKIVEPKPQDVINAAKCYVVAKKIMEDEKCDGISLNCLGLIGARRIPCPPCMAWMKLNDEKSIGCCECAWTSAISIRLCALLAGRPGFMQDPCPNTVAGTLMGAHCSSPTRLRGFDSNPEPVILRNHSESTLGVSPQVIWPIGESVTVMQFTAPDKMIVGTGHMVANIDTPPAGGCRTSVELAMDNVADPRDCKGFHQLFIVGKLDRMFRQYCQLAGIHVDPV